jgi:hypothetical protein
LTPAATNRAALAGPSRNTGDESVQRPRAILALEASLRESRTAVRSAQAARIARMVASISGPAQYPGPRGGGGDQNIGTGTRARTQAEMGWRRARYAPLTHLDLWKTGIAPPDQQATFGYQKCTICHFAKSHPVS